MAGKITAAAGGRADGPGPSSDEIMQALAEAIKEADFAATVALLHLLAVKDPDRARTVYDGLAVVLDLGTRTDTPC
jgi:hypothetical protein